MRCWMLIGSLLLTACVTGTGKQWVNEVNPAAFWPRDHYECKAEAEASETLPAANLAGSIAYGMNLARRQDQCMAARGWALVEAESDTATTAPAAVVPVDLLSTPSSGEVFIDGGPLIGTTPIYNYLLLPGPHVVEVRKDGFELWRRELHVQAGSPTRLRAELQVK